MHEVVNTRLLIEYLWDASVYHPGGEGCSTAGGCATCPFMKMNDLDALLDVAGHADKSGKVPGELR